MVDLLGRGEVTRAAAKIDIIDVEIIDVADIFHRCRPGFRVP